MKEQRQRSNLSDIGIILSRTDYGERDRIITVLTKNHGKLNALAKGTRSPKSKLAGGIELFALNHLVFVKGKSDLLTLTSSRMEKYFSFIISDLDRTMVGYRAFKNINKIAPEGSGADYFQTLLNLLGALNDKEIPLAQIKIWFDMKLLNFIGVSPNIKTLKNGTPLEGSKHFVYDFENQCFEVSADGPYSSDHIKILRYFDTKSKMIPIIACPDDILKKTEHLTFLLTQEHLS